MMSYNTNDVMRSYGIDHAWKTNLRKEARSQD